MFIKEHFVKQKLSWISLVLLLAMLVPSLALAQTDHRETEDTLDKMIREGWSPVADGVLQRSQGGSRVETFAIGPEGLRWALQDLENRLAFLQKQYRAHRKADLLRAINDLKGSIAKLQEDLVNAEAEPFEALAEKNGCSVSYGSNADAYYLTNVAGIAATASASFNNTCGYFTETHAYAYASATRGTLTETLTQSDPKSGYGNNVSNAAASVQGSGPCYSEAYSFARFTGGNIFLSFSDTNYSCPTPVTPLSVSITGGSWGESFNYYDGCVYRTWTASASGGTPGYSYTWDIDGYQVGTGSSYSGYICPGDWSFTISVTAGDSSSPQKSASDSRYVSVYTSNGGSNCGELRFCHDDPIK